MAFASVRGHLSACIPVVMGRKRAHSRIALVGDRPRLHLEVVLETGGCGKMSDMTQKLKKLVERAGTWPQEAQDELVQVAAEIEHDLGAGPYTATPEELEAIDEGRAQFARGEVATDDEVAAAFAKFRRA